jgi:hypothetical protein
MRFDGSFDVNGEKGAGAPLLSGAPLYARQ